MRDIDRRRHQKKLMKKRCTGKIKYLEKNSAIAAASAIGHRAGEKYRAYLCNFCHCYHIGHVDKKSL